MRDPVTRSSAALSDTGQVKDGEAPADLQKRLAADLGTLSTSNQQIADAINKAGAPKTDNGAGLQRTPSTSSSRPRRATRTSRRNCRRCRRTTRRSSPTG